MRFICSLEVLLVPWVNLVGPVRYCTYNRNNNCSGNHEMFIVTNIRLDKLIDYRVSRAAHQCIPEIAPARITAEKDGVHMEITTWSGRIAGTNLIANRG